MEEIDPAPGNDWQPEIPPWSHTEEGRMRRVGVELELIGPDVLEVATIVAEALEGSLEHVSRYEYIVRGDEAGPWRVELDFAFLKEKGREQAAFEEPRSIVDEFSETLVRTGAEAIVPVEVVSPPLPLPRLTSVQQLLPELRRRGALGTRAGLTYAFGMQLNPEVPRRDVDTIRGYMQAFLCLQDWLLRESRVDVTRKLTSFMAPFPDEYAKHVVNASYQPSLEQLIDDYLEFNPTRNRALDLLPLFAELDEARVRKVVQDELVNARPAFHYRLPNSEIDDPEWGIHVAWHRWLQVEFLASDGSRLAKVCDKYSEFLRRPFGNWRGDWAQEVESWLTPIGDR